jgi:hypothetical protein
LDWNFAQVFNAPFGRVQFQFHDSVNGDSF